MASEYYLREYALTQEPGDFIAVVVDKGISDWEDLAHEMIQQGCSLAPEEIKRLFGEIQEAARSLLHQGQRVTGPLCIITPSIQGVFYGHEDTYDPERHRVQLSVTPHPHFEREWQASLVLHKIEAAGEMIPDQEQVSSR